MAPAGRGRRLCPQQESAFIVTGVSRASIRRIAVGVDGSLASARALDWAIRLAASVEGEVIAVHAHELPVYLPRADGAPYVPEGENWERSARQEFEQRWCAPLAAAGVRHRMVFTIGRPGEVLLQQAAEVAADLIVTGRRDRGKLVELFAGSVSQRMVHHAHCPVVVMPPAPASQVATAASS
jgi:nucleotide-binding universal stress UspA family protein